MHRTQIYLHDGQYEKLKMQSRNVGVSISERIRRSLKKDIRQDPVADTHAFFERLQPLESFADTEPESCVHKLHNTSRLPVLTQPKLNEGVDVPRDFSDYTVTVDEANIPAGVSLLRKVD